MGFGAVVSGVALLLAATGAVGFVTEPRTAPTFAQGQRLRVGCK